MLNLPAPTKKGSASKSTKPKLAKKGVDTSETCLGIIPYKGGLPPIGNIILESAPPPSSRSHSTRRSTAIQTKLPTSRQLSDAPPSSRTRGNKIKTSLPAPSATTETRVCHL